MALLKVTIGLLHFRQGVNLRNRDLETAGSPQIREFSQNFSRSRRAVAFGFDTVLFRRSEVDDCIDTLAVHAQGKRKLDIAATEGVDKSVNLPAAARGTDAVFNSIAIRNRHSA